MIRRFALPVVLLAACGGGGSDAGPGDAGSAVGGSFGGIGADPLADPASGSLLGGAPSPLPPGPAYTISGKLAVAETLAVDADTNDPNQVGRRSNNAFDALQPLSNPVHLTGYLTIAGAGPDGPVKAAGDPVDGYRVSLRAGQVIELDFNADPKAVDIDLFLYDLNRRVVGRSTGTNSYECIRVGVDGEYAIGVELYTQGSSGGSVYQLRIGAPNVDSGCVNGQFAAGTMIADEIVVRPAAAASPAQGATTKGAAPRAPAGFAVLRGDPAGGTGSALIGLPAAPAVRSAALAAAGIRARTRGAVGAGGSTGATGVQAKAAVAASQADADAVAAWRAGLPAETVALRETIDAAKMLVQSGEVASAQPNFRLRALATQRLAAFPPNDREYPRQRWHYEAIGLPGAMSLLADFVPAQPRNPIVAVLDGGIVADHPDLAAQLVPGHDFVSNLDIAGDGDGADADPDDPSGGAAARASTGFHGTHVAGTIAAESFNGVGVASVAPVARVMPVRILGVTGGGSYFDIDQGIRYAAGLANVSGRRVQPVDVINLSLGAAGVGCDATTQALFNEVRAAGTLVVAASGNESTPGQSAPVGFPANCETVFAVGATDARGARAKYSNTGAQLMVVAPGGDLDMSSTGNGAPDGIYSTIATRGGDGSRLPSYGYLNGTSMAAPHVAGVLALMRWINPALTAPAIERLIRDGTIVDDLGAPGRDVEFGYGLIDAQKAVAAALATVQAPVPAPMPLGQVEAQPSALSVGATRESADFALRMVGAGDERIVSITTDSTLIAVAPLAGAVDPANGLGDYRITVDRSAMAIGTTAFPKVIVDLLPARRIEIPVTVERRADTSGLGDLGPLYLLVLDADDAKERIVAEVGIAAPSAGVYAYSLTVPGTRRIKVIAGSDLNNDGLVCARGEGCGAYPVLSSTVKILEPTGNLTGIDFSVAPLGGVNPLAAAGLWRR
ncbi:MAG: S8 family serine peptidase [Lautropia sp.]